MTITGAPGGRVSPDQLPRYFWSPTGSLGEARETPRDRIPFFTLLFSEAQTAVSHVSVFNRAHQPIAYLGCKASSLQIRLVAGALAGATAIFSDSLNQSNPGKACKEGASCLCPFPKTMEPSVTRRIARLIKNLSCSNNMGGRPENGGRIMQVTFCCSAPAWKRMNSSL